jgi:hypothetical protein
MDCCCVTVDDFKAQFSRNFPYLPVWQEDKVYFEGDEVYVEPNFYQSLINENTAEVTDTESWSVISDDIANYVSDNDIERARAEAVAAFNLNIAGNKEAARVVFLYLWAFYLAYDLSLAQGGAYGSVNFPVTSVTVGSVSESYYVPKAYLEDPVLGFYARNGFGLKYLSLVYPNLIGNVGVVAGWSLP